MKTENILDLITQEYPDESILKADGFDDAVIGIDRNSMRLIYSVQKMIDILIEEDMSEEDVIEHLEFNVFCAYVGENTPIYCHDNWG